MLIVNKRVSESEKNTLEVNELCKLRKTTLNSCEDPHNSLCKKYLNHKLYKLRKSTLTSCEGPHNPVCMKLFSQCKQHFKSKKNSIAT